LQQKSPENLLQTQDMSVQESMLNIDSFSEINVDINSESQTTVG
jgi:hypothetical protein